MGVHIFCLDESYSISYSGFSLIRKEIVDATIAYIENLKFKNDENFKNFLFFENPKISFDSIKDELLLSLKRIYVGDKYVKRINQKIVKDNDFVDNLRIFDILGLKIILDHYDCQGFLTPNEAEDILQLYKKIQTFYPFYIENEKIMEKIPLYNVLKESMEKKELIKFQ